MSEKVDRTDDWMNPPKREPLTYKPQKYPCYLIERKRRLDYYPFTEWAHWKTFESRTERDEELADLRTKHPAWLLRKRDEHHAPIAYF